jgi:predicted oxidoreductase
LEDQRPRQLQPRHKIKPLVLGEIQAADETVRLIPSELGTFAGIQTNASAQVIDSDSRPIVGLYAVGNDAASVMGGTYPGAGTTIGPAMTFGYIAGRHGRPGIRKSRNLMPRRG